MPWFQILTNLYFNLLDAVFFNLSLKPKMKLPASYLCYMIPSVIWVLMGFVWFPNNNVIASSWIIFMLIYVVFAFRDKIFYRVISFLFFTVMQIITDMLSYHIGVFIAASESDYMVSATYIYMLLKLLSVIYISYVLKAIERERLNWKSLSFLVLPIMQTTVVMLLKLVLQGSINRRDFLELYKETFITNKMLGYGMIAIMIVFNIVDMVAFSGFVENSKMAKLKAKMEVAQYQNEINYKYYSDIKDNAIEMHKIRHDLNNILQSIYNIIYSSGGDETGEAKRLFEGLKEKAENLKIVSYCPNELINAIVSAKKSECEAFCINITLSSM